MLDHDELTISSLDAADPRRVRSKVAGPTTLLVAKAHKIQDRLEDTARRDRLSDKDAADVYRLMLGMPVPEVRTMAARLERNAVTASGTRRGLALLRRQFGAPRAPGVRMAVRALPGVPPERIGAVCAGFVAGLGEG